MTQIGLIGLGGMGSVHARQYAKMPDVALTVFDIDPERTKLFAQQTRSRSAASIDEILAIADAVDICLPTDLHLDTGVAAIDAGCAVLMEKPMARYTKEAERLAGFAEEAGVLFMPGQVVRFFPEFRTGHDAVRSGQIGRPAAARVRRGGHAPVGIGGWFLDPARSGGVLLDLAIHDFDWLRWTLGEVKSVYSRSVALSNSDFEGPGDYALTTLEFIDGAIAHVESTWMDPSGFRTSFEICGSEGMIQHDSRNDNALRRTTIEDTVTENGLAAGDDPYYQEIRSFVDAVAYGKPLLVTAQDGLAAVRIAEAAVESAKSGRVISLA